jgi:SAM-dependent methyltransferase
VYGRDLAWIHHTGFSGFAREAASGIIAILRRHGIDDGLIVDAGCGSGVLSRALESAGFDVFGFDASPSMIEIARSIESRARYEAVTLETASLPPCRAIVAIGEVLNYGDIRAFIPRASAALEKGGVFLFDIAETVVEEELRLGGDDWSVIAIKEVHGRRLTRRVLTFREVDGAVQRDEEIHDIELYDHDEIAARLRAAGFRVRMRRSYGSRRLPPGHWVFESVKRARRSGGRMGQASFVRPNTR